ncbi:MAG: amylo-alpha-1,6-glucosidase [Polyangiales bacterium]
MSLPDGQREWLERGPGGSFALGCVDRRLRRKYHALLTVREPGRGDAWSVLAEVHEALSHGDLAPVLLCDVVSGEETEAALTDFAATPCVTHRYRVRDLTLTRAVRISGDQVEVRYEVRGLQQGDAPVTLALAPLLRCRAIHALTFENPFLDGAVTEEGPGLFRMEPYGGMPSIALRVQGAVGSDAAREHEVAPARFASNGRWLPGPYYPWEAARGYEARENLFTPGELIVTLPRDGVVTLSVGLDVANPAGAWPALLAPAPERPTFADKLAHAARAYLMQTRAGATTVVAGFPWFGPWGRDALIALPGIYLATGFDEAAAVLEAMLAARVDGLIPNIPAMGDAPANMSSVDASLLFARAVQWLGDAAGADKVARFMPGVCELLEAMADARDPRMRLDDGVGVWTTRGPWALTWMDAVVDGQPVTPRAGYAVEIDALAYNAARFATDWAHAHGGRSKPTFARAFRTRLRHAEADFVRRYWDDTRGYLADTHDGERADPSLRPNQLFALGLPHRPIEGAMARSALEAVTRALVVPAGLRTLAPGSPVYAGRYEGDQRARDLAYHQGTVWPWLVGIYADAVRAVHGHEGLEARLAPMFSFFARHLDDEGCIGQVSEVFDGDPPHAAQGTPAQAWSVTELLRALRMLQTPKAT